MFQHITRYKTKGGPGAPLSTVTVAVNARPNQVRINMPRSVSDAAGVNGSAEVFYDAENHRALIKPAAPTSRTAYKVTETSTTCKSIAFRNTTGLAPSKTLRKDWEVTSDGLIVQL